MSDDLRRDDDFDNSIRPRRADGSVPQKSSKKWLWIILGVGAAALLLCCGLGGFGAYFGLSAVGQVIAEGVQDQPAVQENIGTVSKASIAMQRTAELAEADPGVMVLAVEGDKGSGELLLKQVQGTNRFENVRLLMPDGTEYPLEDFTLEEGPAGAVPSDAPVELDDETDDADDDDNMVLDGLRQSEDALDSDPTDSAPTDSEPVEVDAPAGAAN